MRLFSVQAKAPDHIHERKILTHFIKYARSIKFVKLLKHGFSRLLDDT